MQRKKKKWIRVVTGLLGAMLLGGCATHELTAGQPMVSVPWGVEFLAWVGVVAILVLVFGFVLWMGPFADE